MTITEIDRHGCLLTIRETASRLNCSIKTVRRLVHAGTLPAVKVGGGYRVDAAELAEYVYSTENEAA